MESANCKVAVLYVSENGKLLGEKLALFLGDAVLVDLKGDLSNRVASAWHASESLIFIMASGIAVRAIAPHIKDKFTDPSVVVIDEAGHYTISLLSGHIGGGNALTQKLSRYLGNTGVITTASDNLGLTALDLWLQKNKLFVQQRDVLTRKSAKLNREKRISCFVDMSYIGFLPGDIVITEEIEHADIIISHNNSMLLMFPDKLIAAPQNLFAGIGCNRNTAVAEIETCFEELLLQHKLIKQCFSGFGSIDLKINEDGLMQFARKIGKPISFFNKSLLNTIENIQYSSIVMQVTGAKGVAEPAALLLASTNNKGGELLVHKQKWPNVTMAVSCNILRLQA